MLGGGSRLGYKGIFLSSSTPLDEEAIQRLVETDESEGIESKQRSEVGVIDYEQFFKQKLGCRAFGLNIS